MILYYCIQSKHNVQGGVYLYVALACTSRFASVLKIDVTPILFAGIHSISCRINPHKQNGFHAILYSDFKSFVHECDVVFELYSTLIFMVVATLKQQILCIPQVACILQHIVSNTSDTLYLQPWDIHWICLITTWLMYKIFYIGYWILQLC